MRWHGLPFLQIKYPLLLSYTHQFLIKIVSCCESELSIQNSIGHPLSVCKFINEELLLNTVPLFAQSQKWQTRTRNSLTLTNIWLLPNASELLQSFCTSMSFIWWVSHFFFCQHSLNVLSDLPSIQRVFAALSIHKQLYEGKYLINVI